MIAPQEEFYSTPETEVWVAFDVRAPRTAARLHRERAAWAEYADIEGLDLNHYALIVRTGLARPLTGGER